MTTEQEPKLPDGGKLAENLARIEALSARLAAALAQKKPIRPSLQGPGQELYMKAAAAFMAEMMTDPSKLFEHQISYWGKTLKHAAEAQAALAQDPVAGVPDDPGPADARFANPAWDTNPYFNFLKQSYLNASQAIGESIGDLDGLDAHDRERLAYFTRQMVDMLAPTNFLASNPEALEKALETEGQSLIDGLENMVRDLEEHGGELVVTLADPDAFEVGVNLALSPGQVVFRNRMFELIMYEPAGEKVHATPLLIFPPWINKFYILDLKPENSLIKWIIEQGFTLFVVSWVNPDAGFGDVGMDTYIEEGYLTAIEEVKAIYGVRKINTLGYCIGGTMLALTLALLRRRGDKSVKSATFFTTLTDFSDPGEVGMFLDNDFVDGLEAEIAEKGHLDSLFMARTFSYLRANDLIYRPAIRSYMLGETPPAFDLLYWNGDATNLAGRFTIEYLRGLCQSNDFARDGFTLMGETLRLEDIDVPLCAISCEGDHIAPWKATYRGVRAMGSPDKTFILSESGHIAGIVNPPSKKKYGHYTNEDWPETPERWQAGARFNEGSWWARWGHWLAARSGRKVEARAAAGRGGKRLGAAPGSYVKTKGDH